MRTHPWEVDDALWARVQPLLPPPLPSLRGGRSRVDDRRVFGAILYVLRTGCQWNALPKELCSSSTAHRRFQEWEAGGFFQALWAAGLMEYDELKGIEWERQAVDGAMTKAPFGGAATGPTRLMAARRGPSAACEPTAVGSRWRSWWSEPTVTTRCRWRPRWIRRSWPRPAPSQEARQHLCLDRGYDYEDSLEEAVTRGYEVHIPLPRGQERSQPYAEGSRPRRWVVERRHSWLNRSRRLLVRWDKKAENYLAFLHLACAQLIFGKLERGVGQQAAA
jgi:putative transposase